MPRQRKPSTDPAQEALRNHKDKWNEQTSELISKLISFKRGLNGRGDPKEGMPPSSIKEPLPPEIGSILGQLAGEFQQVVGDAQRIIQEQSQYSKTRRKKQNKIKAPINSPQVNNQLGDALSKIQSAEFNLVKDASGLSRFWQYFSSIFSKKEFNQQRIGLLSLSNNFNKNLLDFENSILTLDINSIPDSMNKFQKLKYSYEALRRSYTRLLDLKKPKENKNVNKEKVSDSVPTEKMMNNLTMLFHFNLFKDQIMKLKSSIREYNEEQDVNLKTMQYQQILIDYNEIINEVIDKVKEDNDGEKINSIEDAIEILNKKSNIDYNIVKLSHNMATRYLKRQLIKALKFNKTATSRLEIAEIIDQIKRIIQDMMFSLEKDIEMDLLNEKFKLLDNYVKEIQFPLSILNSLYREGTYDKNNKSKDKSWDQILNRKMRKDLSRNIE